MDKKSNIKQNKRFVQRRGLSTIVGGVFMIIVIAGGINVTLWSLQQQERVTNSIIEKTDSKLSNLNERIEISDIKVNSNKFNITISNRGNTVANLTSIYIVNETASPKQQYRFDLNNPVDSRKSVTNIGQSLALSLATDKTYSIKIITDIGNSVVQQVTPLSKAPLPMAMYVIPPTITPKENVTILFTVSNNSTEPNFKRPVSPTITYSCVPASSSCIVTQKVAPPSGNTMIPKDSTALFKWVYNVDAPDGTVINFNASMVGAKTGNFVIEKGRVELVESSQTSFSSEIIVSSTLVQKPEIFLIAPSPYGDSGQEGLWGVVIANPTTAMMNVSRVVINMHTSKVNSQIEMVPSPCTKSAIYPSPSSEWSCPHENLIEWKNVGSPQSLSGLEARAFMVKVQPGNLPGGMVEPAFTISVAVFTSFGQFTKTGYSSSIIDTSMSLGNVYLTNTDNPSNALQNSRILGNQSGIRSGNQIILNVTVADFDTSSTTYIKSGSKLIINVPKGFTGISIASSTGFNTPTITSYTDGSTQIVAKLAEHVGDVNAAEAKVLSFRVTAPSDLTNKRIYIMHALLDGETNSSYSAAPIAEVALQVVPS